MAVTSVNMVVFKPASTWVLTRRQVSGRIYVGSYEAGIRVIGRRIGHANNVQIIKFKEIFDEGDPYERQSYINLLRREAKTSNFITGYLGYLQGRPLDKFA
ncbi:76_t:CDS:2 [Funneliformis caledonium]|uniref:76_t:CDS:1 n=1 Tax=Funneliformis caledonium TaxID=1117310 RepID=A0A9N9BCX6_9GLOM|nr:76_t:CDS:2 [Funneliformis caledonium]